MGEVMKKQAQEAITVPTFKDYVEEFLLIVFSVVLALLLTTLFQKLHENKQTREVLHELREELITNKKSEEIQLTYHLQVLKNIDSAWLIRPSRKNSLITACLI